MEDAKKRWIGKMGKLKKGALTRTAKKSTGARTKSGKLKTSWLKKKAKGSGVTARRARLALAFKSIARKRKSK